MRFGFVTCVQIGLSCMEAIYSEGGSLNLILSLPDEKAKSKSGRIYVDEFANKHNIPVVKINHINDEEALEAIRHHQIDWLFIIGWSQIASKAVINAPINGAIGAHPTLLPEGRGRAAIPWAIIKGLDKTGVSFFKMDEGVDTGLILGQQEVNIEQDETATTLYDKVNQAHETLIKKLYFNLKDNNVDGQVQDEANATIWPGRTPKDGEIFSSMTMVEADRLIRGTTRPYPGAFVIDSDKKITIWKAIKSPDVPDAYPIRLCDGYLYAIDFESSDI